MDTLKKKFDFDFHFSDKDETTVLEYIWVGGRGVDIRGKTRVRISLASVYLNDVTH